MSNIPTTSGPLPVGVSSGGQEDEEEEQGDSQESFILVWLPERQRQKSASSTCFSKNNVYPEIYKTGLTAVQQGNVNSSASR